MGKNLLVKVVIRKKNVGMHPAIINPEFGSKTVLVKNPWEFVEIWLRKKGHKKAVFFWQQAKYFYEASESLPLTSAPLTTYYCFLNATKTLLLVKNVNFAERHGVSGYVKNSQKTSLSNEIVRFKQGGILASLSQYLGETIHSSEDYSLKDIIYNLPFVHRAFTLTFKSSEELFIPIKNPRFLKNIGNPITRFYADVDQNYSEDLRYLPEDFEITGDGKNKIRTCNRFDWINENHDKSVRRLINFHKKLRKNIYYITGPHKSWYIKKRLNSNKVITKSTLTLTFAAMHRLSELSRYNPDLLKRHLDNQYHWLLSEFIRNAPLQFIDEISSEITGLEFVPPWYAKM